MVSVLLCTINPIASYLSQIYQEDPIVVNLGALLFALMHPIFTFPASYVIDTFGSKIGIAIGCILGLVGVFIRLFINYSFILFIVGQVVAGIGRPFILNCQSKISANWFPTESRGLVTQISTLTINLSIIVGTLVPGLIFRNYEPNSENIE